MIIGVFSDVHDAIGNLEKAINRFQKENAEALVFCGDFVHLLQQHSFLNVAFLFTLFLEIMTETDFRYSTKLTVARLKSMVNILAIWILSWFWTD